jgi:hypothetical protein
VIMPTGYRFIPDEGIGNTPGATRKTSPRRQILRRIPKHYSSKRERGESTCGALFWDLAVWDLGVPARPGW